MKFSLSGWFCSTYFLNSFGISLQELVGIIILSVSFYYFTSWKLNLYVMELVWFVILWTQTVNTILFSFKFVKYYQIKNGMGVMLIFQLSFEISRWNFWYRFLIFANEFQAKNAFCCFAIIWRNRPYFVSLTSFRKF